MMFVHRTLGVVAAALLLFIAVTGTLIAVTDLRPLVTKAPASNLDLQAMRSHANGPPNYAVLSVPDYTALALPADLDYRASFTRLAALARATDPASPLRFVELRMAAGKPAGHVQLGKERHIFDLASGTPLPAAELPPPNPPVIRTTRETFKGIHRLRFISSKAVVLSVVAGIVFAVLIFTGLSHYFRLLASRRKQGRDGLLWRSGGWWRDLHRWVVVVAGTFVIILTLSGIGLAINSSGLEWHNMTHRPAPGEVNPFMGDASSPLQDGELTVMTQTTLTAFNKDMPDTAIRVLRLRYFAGYPQGVVVTAGENPVQRVFNTNTSEVMSLTEPGYPDNGFPFGWQAHQWLKQIHRGDLFGMPGRWFQTLGGLALIYLAASGIVMYVQMWLRRQRNGRTGWWWR